MKHEFSLQNALYQVLPVYRRNETKLTIDGKPFVAQLNWIDDFECQLTLDGKRYSAIVAQDDNNLFVHIDGKTLSLTLVDSAAEAMAADVVEGTQVEAPMPGVVIDVLVAEGDEVKEGQTLLLIESMKLQIELKAKIDGVVETVPTSQGASFNKGDVLMTLAIGEEEASK
ncbi:biotin/lipoyl-binding protein [Aestuariicella hydrocarbonica]|uniref:Biotin/lipoyl-binding protein n=1 Tax=Pseudomaricurvus hydrocarbonicus TaxID=1470433 RepID=A0A9E5MGJ3_9GAMM|nr:biotin/lipoyl-containing protein [Aestuariicella hydrocarbonica]NHO64746.1 biotin/lipoyl-binding protein [Aestuariicella hydrocarbonica]